MSRWTDLAVWRGPTRNEGDGDGTPGEAADRLSSCRGLVVHIASGFYDGTISWERNPDANVSSHFVLGRGGQLAQLVDTADRAWTQRDGNSDWLSVECEGFALDDALHAQHPGWELLTDAQINGVARLLVRGHEQYGYPLTLAGSPAGRGLGYHSMGFEAGLNWGHAHCPGEPIKAQLPTILARAKTLAAGSNLAEDDMNLTDPVPGTGTSDGHPQNRTVVEVLGDLWLSLRAGQKPPLWQAAGPDAAIAAAAGVKSLLTNPAGIDADYLARTIADALIESNANKLTADDHASIVADVKVALRDGTDG